MHDWIVVSVEAARPPQFKTATMSSNQVSDTTAASLLVEAQTPTTTQAKLKGGPDIAPYKVAPSNSNDTDSTECSGVTAQPENISASSTYAPVAAPHKLTALTKDGLERQQRELAVQTPGTLSAWIEGSAPGYAKLVLLEYKGYPHPPRTDPSLASDASYELLPSPVTDGRLEFETRATGTQFDGQCINRLENNADLTLSEASVSSNCRF